VGGYPIIVMDISKESILKEGGFKRMGTTSAFAWPLRRDKEGPKTTKYGILEYKD
jgi:hypothetical protein